MEQKLELWYRKPAGCPEEALPIGNGHLGALIFGHGEREMLALNDDTLWSGYRHDKNRPSAQAYLPLVRKMIAEGKLAEAEKTIQEHMLAEYTESYLPLGELSLTYAYPGSGNITAYRRGLLLNDATASVDYRADGIQYRREYFASYPDHAILIRLTCEKPEMEVAVGFHSPLVHEILTAETGNVYSLTISGQCPEHVDPSYRHNEDKIIQGTRGKAFHAECCLRFTDGVVQVNQDTMRITKASVIELAFLTDSKAAFSQAESYETLKSRHLKDYQRIFNAVELYLGEQDGAPTDERLARLKKEDQDPALYALYFQYGRYLLIASSRKGSQPANLQGIWSWDMTPPWSSNWTTNINLQMNYWHACSCNLLECMEPYFQLLKRICENGKRTAALHYGCRGSVLHHNTDYWASTNPTSIFHGEEQGSDGCVTWAFWVMGEAWLCRELYPYYEYTGDVEFLKSTAYPILRENVLFLCDWLVSNGEVYESMPSTSPENRFVLENGQTCCVSKNCAMDLEIIREVFLSFQKTCRTLKINDELLPEIDDKLSKLAPLKIGSKGQLLEWDEEYKEHEPGHRHMSHLYGLYPSELFDGDDTLQEACRQTLALRIANGGGYTGWSCAWLINLFAILGEPENAYHYLNVLLTRSTYSNLWDAHPPFQIDGNFGGSAGIANMLVQDRGGNLKILPALPAKWREGYVKGLRIKGNRTIDIQWQDGKAVKVNIH